MRLFGYYALHTFVNTIRKLLKTWLVFFFICLVIGGLLGYGMARLIPDDDSENSSTSEEDPGYETNEDIFIDFDNDGVNDLDLTVLNNGKGIFEVAALLAILIILIVVTLTAQDAATKLFKPADVLILFTSPMKPASVLLFRLVTGMGTIFLISMYMVFQLPNMILNMGLLWYHGLAILIAWSLLLVFSQVWQAFLYIFSSSHPKVKKIIPYITWGILALVLIAFTVYYRSSGKNIINALLYFFTREWGRWIPIVGWIKGIAVFTMDGNFLSAGICFGLILIAILLLVVVTWRMKADYYEDAAEKTAELAELVEKAKQSKTGIAKKKKARPDKIASDTFPYGSGANVFFFKAVFIRYRIAYFHVLTKTSILCIILTLGMVWILRMLIITDLFLPIPLMLGIVMFFRALSNNVSEDTHMDYFRTIPESDWLKLLFALLGDAANCFMDILPAMIVGGILMNAGGWDLIGWILFIVTLYLYSICVSNFIDLSLQVSVGNLVKQMVQVLFIYFGLLPDIVFLVIGGLFNIMPFMAIIAASFNLALAGLFYGLTPFFIAKK